MAGVAGERKFLEVPEAANKVIQCLRVFDDPREATQEIEIEFDDGTELSIEIQARLSTHIRLCKTAGGDYQVIREYSSIQGQ